MKPSKDVWLVYNGDKSVKVDRDKVAESCPYLNCLLKGSYKEAAQTVIQVNLGASFSYEAFRSVIRFANDGLFYRDPDKAEVHIGAIQLAMLWNYDEFVTVVEEHLIDRCIIRERIDVLSGLALVNLPTLSRLHEACDKFAESLLRGDLMTLSRCSVDDHSLHAYLDCVRPGEGELEENDWDKKVSYTKPRRESSLPTCYTFETSRIKHNARGTIAQEADESACDEAMHLLIFKGNIKNLKRFPRAYLRN